MILSEPLGVWLMLIGEIELKTRSDIGVAGASLLAILMGKRLGACMT